MKNAFCFNSKALFVLKTFNFLVVQQNGSIRRIKLISKFVRSQSLTNKCNAYIAQYFQNYRQSENEIWSVNRFYTKCGVKTSSFLKMKIEHISGSVGLSFRQFIFFVCLAEGYQNKLKLGCIPLAFTSQEAFSKNKKRSGTSLPNLFSS